MTAAVEVLRSGGVPRATNVIAGLAVGLESTALPVVMISLAVLGSYFVGAGTGLPSAGLFGTAVATSAC
jgi:Na+/H+-translocating membrane pyrophosphatase